ncbi:Coenzyme F420 hydrogenase/dehydrogenase, beta subunit C-terminal domain [Microbacterium testaceum]|uniref:Coenzyme F420 hydrogenase/dehydrogenase, beta subunit C-terminal domain n=1 Tax=Microbacterium testaceum TaxID=2033 RepID=UPI001D177CB2|nr:Coenzyme F420 hydrogenase/dehydrogenase, beta subunit C-terminal domain [Microbacterium testaceum]MCC4249438.1 Coenzyme F420 hydrogenase/dehydrogenase, beta subunit C-terminal domain [Microbacterium testaceum]
MTKSPNRNDGEYLASLRALIAADLEVGSGVLAARSERVTMELDDRGFYRSVLAEDITDEDARQILDVCAMSDFKVADESQLAKKLYGGRADAHFDPILGYFHSLHVGYVEEGSFRSAGSSGGMASWLLSELLRLDLVDYVVHVAESIDEGRLFTYRVSSTPDEVLAGSKSRYYPVELSRVLAIMRRKPGRYAVVGIPTVIFELRLLAEVDDEIGRCVAYTIGLICGHQKSTRYAESFAWQSGIAPSSLDSFDFRVKNGEGKSWDYRMSMTGEIDGRRQTLMRRQSDLFGSDWAWCFFKAKFSDYTDDAFNETADIVVGDAWLPGHEDDPFGSNVVITRRPDLARLIQAGIGERRLRFSEAEVDEVLRSQRGLVRHTRDEIGYRLAQDDRARRVRPQKRFGADPTLPYLRRLVQRQRVLIAQASHVHYLRAVELGDWNHFYRRMRPHIWRYRLLYRVIDLTSALQRNGLIGSVKKLFRL